MALRGVCQFQLHRFPWAARGWSYELTLVYKFWLSNHIVTVTLSQCGFGSEMAWDQAIPGAHFQEFDGVLICSGCYNKIPQTRHLINNRNVFCTVVGDCKPRIRVLSGASFITAIIPFMMALLSSPTHLTEVPTS